jgi:hypothetical protein
VRDGGLESFKRGRHAQLLPYSFLLKFFASSSTSTYWLAYQIPKVFPFLSFFLYFICLHLFFSLYLSLLFSLSLSLSWCFLFLISACSWFDGLHKIYGYRIQVGMFYLLFYVCMWSLRSCWWESGSISTPFAMLSSWVSLLFLAFFSFLVSWVFFLSHPLDFWNFSLHFLFILLSGSQKVRFYIDWMFFPPWYWNGFLEDFFCDFIYLTLGMPNAFKRLLGEYMAP